MSLSFVAAFASCGVEGSLAPEGVDEAAEAVVGAPAAAVGLAIEIENGAGAPLTVAAGQTFYVNQIDLRAVIAASVDEGVSGLDQSGDFASLPWGGISFEEEEPILSPSGDGLFTRRRFYRGAAWIRKASRFDIVPIDTNGQPVGATVHLRIGTDGKRAATDAFFVRRLRAIQWTYDCPALDDCSGASDFEEEALVELRNTRDASQTFTLTPQATALRVTWSQKPQTPYLVPITQDPSPPYAYGLSVDLTPLTPPGPGGYYAPGDDVSFQITLRDGAGTALHAPGSLPTYNEVAFGVNVPGIQYYRAFFDATTTFWRRKHRERMLMSQIIGPAQAIQPIRSIVDIAAFLGAEDTQIIGTIPRDGVYAEFTTIPPANDLFGGAFDPAHAGWAAPVSDTFTYHLPDDVPPGTYLVTIKARRTYRGEDVPFSRTIEIQVGSAQPTTATLPTGPCASCHSEGGELSNVLHANANRAACSGCHAPLSFEHEGPIYVRTHFLHSRSNRFDAPLYKCASCHLTGASIQRVSKSACLSCHTSYPSWHTQQFGAIESIYVGGGAESFDSCTTSCHQSHPGSGL